MISSNVMNQEFASYVGTLGSEFLVLNYASNILSLVSFTIHEFVSAGAACREPTHESGH